MKNPRPPGYRRGTADLPLHGGKAPRWLFQRMVRLSRVMVEALVSEFGPEAFLQRLADPVWFQSFGCVLGFDWHSSGLTTTVTGALKEALKDLRIGVYAAGGKGGTARKTPEMIVRVAERTGLDPQPLIRTSRLVAKVDSVALQDGYDLYHHVMFFTARGSWAVVQQGMNPANRMARRYHWLSEGLSSFVDNPHSGIAAWRRERRVVNFITPRARSARQALLALVRDHTPEAVLQTYAKLQERKLVMPVPHPVGEKDVTPRYLQKVLLSTYARFPGHFEDLLLTPGMGPASLRALALVADVIYGARPSFEDPVVYTFAHGGKDGYPYPVNRAVYDRTVEVLEQALREARLGRREKLEALKRLALWFRV